MTKTARSVSFQRAGGCCEPVRKVRTPIPSELKAPKPEKVSRRFPSSAASVHRASCEPAEWFSFENNLSGTADFYSVSKRFETEFVFYERLRLLK